MVKKSFSVFLQLTCYCTLVNFVYAKTVPPSQVEPFPDLYTLASTYPGTNNVVNYNASPNPQYSSNNFNHFNEPTPQPLPQIQSNYQNIDYQQKPIQQQKSLEEMVTAASPTSTKNYEYSDDLKNTLVSMKDNLGLMSETQRLLLNSFQVQQQQYNNIEEKLKINESSSQRNAGYGSPQNYGAPATIQPIQYQSIPSLLPLPYGQPTHQVHKDHHHKKHTHQKVFGKLFKKHRRGSNRGLALIRRRSETARMERHAAMTLAYIKNGIVNALWTALVVACVKLVPIFLFGFKLMFKSVIPLTGLALFGSNRGLFPQHLKQNDDDDDIRFDDDEEDEEEDEDDEEEDVLEDDDRDNSEEKEKTSHHYR